MGSPLRRWIEQQTGSPTRTPRSPGSLCMRALKPFYLKYRERDPVGSPGFVSVLHSILCWRHERFERQTSWHVGDANHTFEFRFAAA